jgi:hypothetical protein
VKIRVARREAARSRDSAIGLAGIRGTSQQHERTNRSSRGATGSTRTPASRFVGVVLDP